MRERRGGFLLLKRIVENYSCCFELSCRQGLVVMIANTNSLVIALEGTTRLRKQPALAISYYFDLAEVGELV